jgi:hypothetical protein
MRRFSACAVIASLIVSLGACTKVAGDENGGTVSYARDLIEGLRLASAHCEKYDRFAHMTGQNLWETIEFRCGP